MYVLILCSDWKLSQAATGDTRGSDWWWRGAVGGFRTCASGTAQSSSIDLLCALPNRLGRTPRPFANTQACLGCARRLQPPPLFAARAYPRHQPRKCFETRRCVLRHHTIQIRVAACDRNNTVWTKPKAKGCECTSCDQLMCQPLVALVDQHTLKRREFFRQVEDHLRQDIELRVVCRMKHPTPNSLCCMSWVRGLYTGESAPFMASIIVFISSFSGSGHANCTISLSRCHGVKEPHARLTVALICRSPSTYPANTRF